MKLLQYAFDPRIVDDSNPYAYETNTVVYPGTHDNDTVRGWSRTVPQPAVRHAMDYMGIRRRSELPRGMIRLAMQCNASLAMIPMQDWLNLGSGARMNAPSTVGGNNWRWRLPRNALKPKLARAMAKMASLYGRHSDRT